MAASLASALPSLEPAPTAAKPPPNLAFQFALANIACSRSAALRAAARAVAWDLSASAVSSPEVSTKSCRSASPEGTSAAAAASAASASSSSLSARSACTANARARARARARVRVRVRARLHGVLGRTRALCDDLRHHATRREHVGRALVATAAAEKPAAAAAKRHAQLLAQPVVRVLDKAEARVLLSDALGDS